jgi:calmodulin
MKSARSAVEDIETFFTPEMFEEIKILFNNYSTEGFIASTAILETLRAVGQELTSKQLRVVMCEVDADNTGALDFHQYVKLMGNIIGEWDFEARLIEAFKVFDTDDVGSIDVAELRHVMTTLDYKLSTDDTGDFLSSALEASGKGADRVDYEAFAKVMIEALKANAAGKKKKSKKGGKKKKGKKSKK